MCITEHIKMICLVEVIIQDRRVIKTDVAIREAFLYLLQEKPLNRITIAEISRSANISRGTFYLHYRDIYELYTRIDNELFENFGKMYDAAYPSTDPENLASLIEDLTKYVIRNKHVFLLIVKTGDDRNSFFRYKAFFMEKVLQETKKRKGVVSSISNRQFMETVFIVSGVIGVLEEWIYGGINISQPEISSILQQMILCV